MSSSGQSVVPTDGSFENKAYIYRDSPFVFAGPNYGPAHPNMKEFTDQRTPEFITSNTLLNGNCSMNFEFFGTITVNLPECIRVLKNKETSNPVVRNSDRTYIFPVGSSEFYQVNALYHVQKMVNTFHEKLSLSYNLVQAQNISIPKSIPGYLKDTQMQWFKKVDNIDSKLFKFDYVNVFAQCDLNRNAFFSPAGPELCFGYFDTFPDFYFIQDPSVIYHETGHALVSIMMNLRNATPGSYHPFRSNLGSFGYSEASSINEGIADYFSFLMNKRTHFGEWALGRTAKQSRPLTESDPLHIPVLSTTSAGRLSYPQFLLYDPNFPEDQFEDVHYAGQIVSHYLVALTQNLQNKCSLNHDQSTSYLLLLLAETLSEIGDLKAKSVDDFMAPFSANIFFNNLDDVNSYTWTQVNNQTNYRRFFQVFAKNIFKYISGNLCPSFSKNDSEKLLDDYGLLLFKTYNNNGNSTKDRTITYSSAVPFIAPQALTTVSEANRRKSTLVSKSLLSIASKTDANPNRVNFYIIDTRSDMEAILKDLLFKGLPLQLSPDVASVDFNNNNVKVSPGEIVALIPNLLNNSNTTMAGVQLLANDWDHVDVTDRTSGHFKPCVYDSVTTIDQGGEAGRTCLTTETEHKKVIRNPQTNLYPSEGVAPVCLVQMDQGSSTKWVSQNEFRKKQGLSLLDKDCLGYSTNASTDEDFTFNPNECLVRFLPGANTSFFSKIEPQKTYFESVVANQEGSSFNSGNILLLEVNKWIPPGTKFRCRLRAKFANCSDCYNDSTNNQDDFLDVDYNGAKPYQLLNFEFDIND